MTKPTIAQIEAARKVCRYFELQEQRGGFTDDATLFHDVAVKLDAKAFIERVAKKAGIKL